MNHMNHTFHEGHEGYCAHCNKLEGDPKHRRKAINCWQALTWYVAMASLGVLVGFIFLEIVHILRGGEIHPEIY